MRYIPPAIFLAATWIAASAIAPPAAAQNLDPEAIRLIGEAAAAICGDFAREGDWSESQIEGAAEAKLKGLAGKLIDLGIEGGGSLDAGNYAGVLREDLGGELKDMRACRLQIWKDMQAQVLNPATARETSVQPTQTTGLNGLWSYVAICPNPTGYGQLTFNGRIEMWHVRGREYEGKIRSTAGDYGQFTTVLNGTKAVSEIYWDDGSYGTSAGELSADGFSMTVHDSFGCQSQLTRAGG